MLIKEEPLSNVFTHVSKRMNLYILVDINHFQQRVVEELIQNKTLKNALQNSKQA